MQCYNPGNPVVRENKEMYPYCWYEMLFPGLRYLFQYMAPLPEEVSVVAGRKFSSDFGVIPQLGETIEQAVRFSHNLDIMGDRYCDSEHLAFGMYAAGLLLANCPREKSVLQVATWMEETYRPRIRIPFTGSIMLPWSRHSRARYIKLLTDEANREHIAKVYDALFKSRQ